MKNGRHVFHRIDNIVAMMIHVIEVMIRKYLSRSRRMNPVHQFSLRPLRCTRVPSPGLTHGPRLSCDALRCSNGCRCPLPASPTSHTSRERGNKTHLDSRRGQNYGSVMGSCCYLFLRCKTLPTQQRYIFFLYSVAPGLTQ